MAEEVATDGGSTAVPAVRCSVLGPLEVTAPGGRSCTPKGVLQRRLLALLLLRRGRVVSIDTIAESLWPGQLPDGFSAGVHTHVFRLRRRLPEATIEQVAPGYRLSAENLVLDADEFESAVSRAAARRAEEPLVALRDLEQGLALWQGRPFADLIELDEAAIEADRLEEVRQRALEERLAAMLDLDRPDAVVPDAEALVAANPLRERPRELLMRALVGSGRHPDALRTYDDLRRRLAEELGIEPSGQLRELNDRTLAGSAPSGSPAGSAPSASPAGSGTAPAHCPPPRLPRPLVGRESLVGSVERAIEQAPVVTLVGPGGVGKTSVALATAARVADRFPGGVCFIELAGSSTGNVGADVLTAMAAEPRARTAPGRRIADLVGSVPTLLVLDNCEHVLDDVAPLVEDAVAHCSGLRVLGTSRERLAVAGERTVTVAPLRCDSDATDPDLRDGSGVTPPALELFAQRAADAGVTITFDDRTEPIVTEICRRLDGLPLAIELAANRLASLRLEEIRNGLDQSLRLLSGGRRAVPRHRSIAAALTWSFDLLEDRHRDLLAVLSVFASPFTAADAAAVAGRSEPEVTEILADLVERSLLQRTADRFALLEPVRQFVDGTVGDDPARGERALRHARHFTGVAEHIARDVRTSACSEAFARARVLVPDLRAAMSTALERGDMDLATRLCTAVRDPAFLAMLPEPLTWAGEAADAAARSDHAGGPALHGIAALGAWKAGDLAAAADHLEAGAHEARRLGVEPPYEVVDMQGTLAAASGRLDEAIECYRAALATPTGGDDPVRRAETSATLVLTRGYRHDPEAVDDAARLLEQGLPHDCPVGQAWCWYGAGEAVLTTDPDVARHRLARAVELAREAGAAFIEVVAGASLASLEVRTGDPVRAAAQYRWLLPLMQRGEAVSPLWTALRGVAELLVARDDDAAATLLGAVAAPRHGTAVFGDDVGHLDRIRATLVRRVGESHVQRATAVGAELDDAAATVLAVAALDDHLPS